MTQYHIRMRELHQCHIQKLKLLNGEIKTTLICNKYLIITRNLNKQRCDLLVMILTHIYFELKHTLYSQNQYILPALILIV